METPKTRGIMPKVKWVHPDNMRLWENSIDSVPVLTLDAIETWLKRCIKDGYVNISQCIDDMQAMDAGGMGAMTCSICRKACPLDFTGLCDDCKYERD